MGLNNKYYDSKEPYLVRKQSINTLVKYHSALFKQPQGSHKSKEEQRSSMRFGRR